AKFVYDLTDTSFSNDDDSFIDMESLIASRIDVSYQVTLPNKPTSTNCSLISDDGKTLKWVAKYNAITVIEYSFEIINIINIILVAAGVLIVVAAVIVILLLYKKKKINQQ
ncbi:MAG: hypothetical protein GYA50_00920, partial [Eubacteriaceae bacterium]|nr:hypothetical protein [Eubacteriaceae bacterium]